MKIILVIVIILIIFLLTVGIMDSNRFVVREYTVKSDKLKKNHDFLFLSDQHLKEYGKGNCKLIKTLDTLNYEGIFIAGDMITSNKSNYDTALKLLKKLSEKSPVFYSYGNHETKAKKYKASFKEYEKELLNAGVRIYDNEKIAFEDFDIYALTIGLKYYARFKKICLPAGYMESCIGKCDKERFSVLLAHNPDYFESYAEWGANLTLSGHIHGGIIRLPFIGGLLSPKVTFFPKYDGGEFDRNSNKMLVNRGLGSHFVFLRLFNPAEVLIIHLLKE